MARFLKFSDGIVVDTSGELRTACYVDGWYVVGEGYFIPVEDEEEGQDLITDLKLNQEANGESQQ